MSEENNRRPVVWRRDVQSLKKLIRMVLAISIMIPCVCSGVLFTRVQKLDDELQTVNGQIDEMNSLLIEQRELLETMIEESKAQGEENVPVKDDLDSVTQGDDTVENESLQESAGNPEEHAKHKVYLTFDDGPSVYTGDILDILDQYNIKATFFVVGKEDDASKEALREIVERGHSLGMHSYSHKYTEIYESLDSFEEDFIKIQDYLYDATGVKSTIYRFPGGSSNKVSDVDMQQFADYLQAQDVTFYDWNISAGDGGSALLSVQEVVDNCTKDIEDWATSVILLHDSGDKQTTVEALPIIIENILALEDTVILPITEDTEPVQHINTLDTKVKE